ncbi:UNVERIFIED_CONTAM: zinc finger, C3HC4 type (RING finger) domain-containing protein [Hammondia hammondi]|eukprot:XP_008885636.1 zinc finger, C3HC4 type (RING finger) domain-containing protein [Hammondia hammondi]
METPIFSSIETVPAGTDRLSNSFFFRLWPLHRPQQTPLLQLSASPSSAAPSTAVVLSSRPAPSSVIVPASSSVAVSSSSLVGVPSSVTARSFAEVSELSASSLSPPSQATASSSSAPSSRAATAGRLGVFQSFCARRCCYAVSLPRRVADVRRLLDVLFYEQLVFISISACLATAHVVVLVYTCAFEAPLKEPVPFLPILGVMLGLSVATLTIRLRLLWDVRTLQTAWWHRPVLKDTVALLTSPLCQARRVLFVFSFCVYFATLHLAYHHGGTGATSADAPVLLRYISVIVLVFLSLLGPHILLLACICTSFVLCLCSPPEQFEHLLVEEPRSGRALPKKFLQRMKEEKWLPASAAADRENVDATARADTGLEEDREGEREDNTRKRRLVHLCVGRRRKKLRPASQTDTPSGANKAVEDDVICAICLCEFEENDWIRRLPCQHFFHSACIARWLRSHASCPLRCHVNFFTGEVYSSSPSHAVGAFPRRHRRAHRAAVTRSEVIPEARQASGESERGVGEAGAAEETEGSELVERQAHAEAQTRWEERERRQRETGTEEGREQVRIWMSEDVDVRLLGPGEETQLFLGGESNPARASVSHA